MSLRLGGSFLGNQNQMSFIFVSVLVNKLEYTFERTNGKREVRTLIEPKIFKNFKVRADGFFCLGDRILDVSFEKISDKVKQQMSDK